VVEHSIGNGEVDSSILSGSTSFSAVNAFQNRHKSRVFGWPGCKARPSNMRPDEAQRLQADPVTSYAHPAISYLANLVCGKSLFQSTLINLCLINL
jgi:hypothetical protein